MVGLLPLEESILVRVQVRQQMSEANFCETQDSNAKGVGETVVSPWRKDWENRGFPRSSQSKSGSQKKNSK